MMKRDCLFMAIVINVACGDNLLRCPESRPTLLTILMQRDPELAMVRNGSEPWEALESAEDGVIEVCVADDYVVSVVCSQPDGTVHSTQLARGPAEESELFGCLAGQPPALITGSMRQPGIVAVGRYAHSNPTSDWSFSFVTETGLQDVIASDGYYGSPEPRVLLQRSVVVPEEGLDLATLDLSVMGTPLVPVEIAVENADGRELYGSSTSIVTQHGGTTIAQAAGLTTHVVPAELLLGGDLQFVELQATIAVSARKQLQRGGSHLPAGERSYFILLPLLEELAYTIEPTGLEVPLAETSLVPQVAELVLISGDRDSLQSQSVTKAWLDRNPGVQHIRFDTDIPGYRPEWRVDVPQLIVFGIIEETETQFDFTFYTEVFGGPSSRIESWIPPEVRKVPRWRSRRPDDRAVLTNPTLEAAAE